MALNEELKKQGDFLFRYRSYFPIALLLAGLGFVAYTEWTDPEVGYTPRNTSGRNTAAGQVAESLNTGGMYSLTRNPLYLGNYLMWLGVALLTASLGFILVFTLVFWIYYERIVFAEESFLRKKFGDAYLDWASVTPAFIPRKLKWRKPGLSFSWKKVLKKEKNGLFALFLVFCLIELEGSLIGDGTWIIEETWLFWAMILSALAYVVLKILKSGTRLLDEEGR
jgi:hypothetical protein